MTTSQPDQVSATDTAGTDLDAGGTEPTVTQQTETDSIEGPKVNEYGYPDGTPLAQMTLEQQNAYWKHKARKHENTAKEYRDGLTADQAQSLREELDALKAEKLSDGEREFNQAVTDAKQSGYDAARAELLPVLQEAQLRGYASTVIDGGRLEAWVKSANSAMFLDNEGAINGAAVVEHLTELFGEKSERSATPPAGQRHANFGQGAPTGGSSRPSHFDVGRAEAEKRFKKTA